MILDVGCGNHPQGDINVDKCRHTFEIAQKSKIPIKTKANVIAVGEYLPFIDNTFDNVICIHTIEHADNPLQFLKELIRVSKRHIKIRCPHRFSSLAKMPYHKNFFNKKWFKTALEKMDVRFKISSNYQPFPSFSLFINLVKRTFEISIDIQKTETSKDLS